jgi:hypothetical protein
MSGDGLGICPHCGSPLDSAGHVRTVELDEPSRRRVVSFCVTSRHHVVSRSPGPLRMWVRSRLSKRSVCQTNGVDESRGIETE